MTTCSMAGLGGFDCQGPTDLHHLVHRSVIKRRFPFGALEDGTPATRLQRPRTPQLDLLCDRRNLVSCCRQHHANHHNARFTIGREHLPESEEFAAQFGFVPWLERSYGREAA